MALVLLKHVYCSHPVILTPVPVLRSQYYEMSYGLNIEMHKQVDILITVFSVCISSFLFGSLPLSLFALPLLRQGFDIFGVCARLLTCPCVCTDALVCLCVRVCACVYL